MRISFNKKHFLYFYMFGFIAGILYANTIAKSYLIASGVLTDYFLKQYVNTEFVTAQYGIYIFKLRALPVAVIAMLGQTKFKKILSVGVLLWTGFASGLIAVEAIIKMGAKGIGLCLIGILPHFIFYFLAYIMILWFLYSYPTKRWNMSKTVFVILAMGMGIITEVYVNPILMKLFMKLL